MSFIYIMTPETGNKKADMALACRGCNYFRMDSVALNPLLVLDYLKDEDWLRGHYSKDLLEKCDRVAVVCDEVTEKMISEIKYAQEKKLKILFYDSDLHEINVDALVINKRIGPGLRKMIMDVNGLSCSDGGCPYANGGAETVIAVKEPEAEQRSESPVTENEDSRPEKKSLLKRLFGRD